MGIFKVGLNVVKFAAKNIFRTSENVSAARSAVKGSIFKPSVAKARAKAGWQALKQDYKSSSSVGIIDGIKNSVKSITKTFKDEVSAGLKSVSKNSGKIAKFLGGTKGILKGTFKCMKKLPIIGSVIMLGEEAPKVYQAFKEDGFFAGVGQIARSSAQLVAGAGLAAIGTAIGGPVGGFAGWIIGDMIASAIVGESKYKGASERILEGVFASEESEQQKQSTMQSESEVVQSQGGEVLQGQAQSQQQTDETQKEALSQVQTVQSPTLEAIELDEVQNSGESVNIGKNLSSQSTSSDLVSNNSASNPFSYGTENIPTFNPFMMTNNMFNNPSMLSNPFMSGMNFCLTNPYMNMGMFGIGSSFGLNGNIFGQGFQNPRFQYIGC
ncbi:hypothetical protein J6G99_08170 [bacterium]|nr:hypothetical protein [bacterium]